MVDGGGSSKRACRECQATDASQPTCQEFVLDLIVQEGVFQTAELSLQAAKVGLAHRLGLFRRAVLHRRKTLMGCALQQVQRPARTWRGMHVSFAATWLGCLQLRLVSGGGAACKSLTC